MPTVYPDPKTVTPREVLRGLRGIIEHEQMDRAGYIAREVNQELAEAGALCRGHRACAVGATWLAAGVEPIRHEPYGQFSLPGVDGRHEYRLDWLGAKGYDGLRAAYAALCEAAQEYMDKRGLSVSEAWRAGGALEGLFESKHDDPDDGEYLIEPWLMEVVIDRAEELIEP